MELRDIELRVDGQAHIHPTNLALAAGEFNVLLGPTLAGKTTLMRLMAGLLAPSSGSLWFGGRDVTAKPVRERNVAMVYQQFINFGHWSVYDNIASPLRVQGVAEGEVRTRVGKIAELLRLSPMLERKPAELSGGQQQRTALARALVKDAALVLLDEPLANLDYKLREELRDELPRLFADRDCTVVYATTEPGEALLLGGHTATLHEGRVTQFGATGDVYRRPDDLLTASTFSDPPINTASVSKRGTQIELGGVARWPAEGDAQRMPDGDYTFALRPHHVQPGAGDGGIGVRGPVSIAEISGSESVVHFDLGGRTWVSQSHGVHRFAVGEQAEFTLDVARGLYFRADGSRVN